MPAQPKPSHDRVDQPDFAILPERPADGAAIEALAAAAFGPGRFAKTAYRLRERAVAVPELAFVSLAGGEVVGSVRFSAILAGSVPALLLGPLVVHPGHKNRGHGLSLMATSLEAARAGGHRLAILVGDAPYYARAGFVPVPAGRLVMPGPVDPARLLALELAAGALGGARGPVMPSPAP